MSAREAVRIAFAAVAANGLRSFLTVLGVVIGVMSVVLLVAVGTGARDEVTAGVEDLGANLLFVAPGEFSFGQAPTLSKLTLTDVDAVRRALPPTATVAATLVSGERVRGGTSSGAFATVIGATAAFAEVLNRDLGRGEFLNDGDVTTARRVAVLGASVADALFAGRDPIGKFVTVAGVRFRVIGALAPVGSALGVDRDSEVIVPITAAQRLFGTRRVDTLFVEAGDQASIGAVRDTITATLSQRLEADEFSVLTQQELLGVAGRFLGILTLVLVAIAAISLLVGGIGVSNIMLVSVQERTREIGLRKALGARTRDITLQFLVEAVVLCGLGGVLGLAVGVGLAVLAEAVTPLPATVTGWSAALAFSTSLLVGIGFGVFPARRAGRLDPVVALRYE